MQKYFQQLEDETDVLYNIAEQARAVGKDPTTKVEVPRADDLASRVETLLADYDVAGLANLIRELSKKESNREMVAIMAAKEFAARDKDTKDPAAREKALDRAVRIGLAIVTEGILVAPLEGIAYTRIRKNDDGTEFADLVFAGPIRASGGTGQALSVLICDVVRQAMGISKYIATEGEINRFIEEIPLYKQCQHLQFTPSDSEIRTIVTECPVMVDGEGTEQMEISGYRDLPRIETNKVRGGACLVIAEGMCLKASKIKKHVDKLGLKGWDFIQKYLDAHKNVGGDEKGKKKVVEPSTKYLKDMVAGRPIFGHPCRVGGFRLRYGRARTSGLASLAYNPASMYAMDEFLALGTQLKIERPGKACVVTPVRSIEGPTLLLTNGDLVYCDTKEDYFAIRDRVLNVVDNGEILVPFGEFCENNHVLVPSGYPIEWHREELKHVLGDQPLPDDYIHPTYERSKEMSRMYGVALHPDYNLFWNDISFTRLTQLRECLLLSGRFENGCVSVPLDREGIPPSIEENDPTVKRILETLGAIHTVRNKRVIINERYSRPVLDALGLGNDGDRIIQVRPFENLTISVRPCLDLPVYEVPRDDVKKLAAYVLTNGSTDGKSLTFPTDADVVRILNEFKLPFTESDGVITVDGRYSATFMETLGVGKHPTGIASATDLPEDAPEGQAAMRKHVLKNGAIKDGCVTMPFDKGIADFETLIGVPFETYYKDKPSYRIGAENRDAFLSQFGLAVAATEQSDDPDGEKAPDSITSAVDLPEDASEDLVKMRDHILKNGAIKDGCVTMPFDKGIADFETHIGVPFETFHKDKPSYKIGAENRDAFLSQFGLTTVTIDLVRDLDSDEILDSISYAAGYFVRARAMTRIGTRMGRPEKAKERAGSPLVQSLFPLSDAEHTFKDTVSAIKGLAAEASMSGTATFGGSEAKSEGVLRPDMGVRYCPECARETYSTWCRACCCHTLESPNKRNLDQKPLPVDVAAEYNAALEAINRAAAVEVRMEGQQDTGDLVSAAVVTGRSLAGEEALRCCEKLTSRTKTPEIMEKGILRRKHNISMFRDGTIRYDMTDIPLTHFRPREIGLSIEKAHELGYTKDWNGDPLVDPDQICELKCQDIVPARECGDYMVRVSQFIDDELRYIYNQPRFYNAKDRSDLIGAITFGLAPHTSGCILCRIIGYAGARGCYGHPFYHASKRRNCDGDEDCIILALDGLLNFSKVFLPSRRGGLMDSPLVLTTRLDPNEIDKEAQNVDCLRAYPRELYLAAADMKDPKSISKIMDLVEGRIGKETQYETLGYTHDTPDISEGPRESAYTTLGSMTDKMEAQLALGEKCRSVDAPDVALKVINKHFMPDMIGNLRSFATQGVRCPKCGAKYRRVPLAGVCISKTCKKGSQSSKLILTVTEPSVRKYLEVSKDVCVRNNLDNYTQERIAIIEQNMDSLFHNDKVKKSKLTDFF